MEDKEVAATDSLALVHKLQTIEEDELESEVVKETTVEPQDLPHGSEMKKKHGARWENSISEEGKDPTDGQTSSLMNSKSIVSSMKRVISSLGPSAPSLIADFVHINDCLKESSGKSPDQTDTFMTDLCLHLVMVRNGVPDPELQRELRKRLRLLENDSKEVAAVFSELSARLISIESDKDLIIVTFKTFEEIWKFSTYYSLGFLNHCMENMFLDQSFWLSSPEEDDAEIQVCVNEESLNLICKGLLMEEEDVQS